MHIKAIFNMFKDDFNCLQPIGAYIQQDGKTIVFIN